VSARPRCRLSLDWFFVNRPIDLLVSLGCEATRVQDDYGGDGSGCHGENPESMAPPPASGRDELRRQAAKERILREEAETLALEAEVRREIMEELRSQVARSAAACARGSEARATPAADSPPLNTEIAHEVCFSSPVLIRIHSAC
jgi:hypothetical protein